MIEGYFDRHGRPYLQGRLIIERLQVDGPIEFLVDTGSDGTVLHPKDGQLLNVVLICCNVLPASGESEEHRATIVSQAPF